MQQEHLWQAVLGDIEITVSRGNFITWFKNTCLLKNKDDLVVIGVPNVFIKQQLERKYNDLIAETLKKNGVTPQTIEYKIHTTARQQPTASSDELLEKPHEPVVTSSAELGPNTTQTSQPRGQTSSLSRAYRQGLNEKYTFDNFVVGGANELAYAACQAIAVNPGTKYNPLFVYGGVGIGKTHLIQAVGNAILANKKTARIVYVTSEQFLQEFVDALRFKKNTDFADFYRSADVLIVDDIQFIAGKEKVQEEFFHTFNALHQSSKQIIISSDKPPHSIATLEERLRSRFAWGMSIDMQNPDFETRCAIVQAKAQAAGTILPNDVMEYLATNAGGNIRELEGALNQLLAFCEMRELEPNLAVVSGLVSGAHNRPKHLSSRQIVERCAHHFQISIEDMLGPKRDKDIVVPRQVAMYMLRSELHMSFPKIARELGRKDHTTAIHSVEKITKESHFDADLRTALSEIKERLYV